MQTLHTHTGMHVHGLFILAASWICYLRCLKMQEKERARKRGETREKERRDEREREKMKQKKTLGCMLSFILYSIVSEDKCVLGFNLKSLKFVCTACATKCTSHGYVHAINRPFLHQRENGLTTNLLPQTECLSAVFSLSSSSKERGESLWMEIWFVDVTMSTKTRSIYDRICIYGSHFLKHPNDFAIRKTFKNKAIRFNQSFLMLGGKSQKPETFLGRCKRKASVRIPFYAHHRAIMRF